jgi:hypothetical protein
MSLSNVREIERAITALKPEELDELYAWLDEYADRSIDTQVKSDVDAGRLDDRIQRALANHQAGKTRPF